MAIYGYVRVSTKAQLENNSLEMQEAEILNKYADAEIIKEQFSGAKVQDRPKFFKLISELKSGDMLVVTKLDRFARNTVEGLKVVEDLLAKGVSIYIMNMGLIEDTPTGRLTLTVFSAFAQYERDIITERMQTAREHKRQTDANYKDGRRKCYTSGQREMIIRLKLEGKTYPEIASAVGVSRATVGRILKEERDNGAEI